MKTIVNLLVSLNQNYLPQLRVMLVSLALNNPGLNYRLFLLYRGFSDETLQELAQQVSCLRGELHPVQVDENLFRTAPVTRQYPQEMYYRLLAARLLPPELDRVLYLDPDILILNSILPLWQQDMHGCLFAAAAHTGKAELVDGVNRLRLGTGQEYFNSGVLLMDLARCRHEITPEQIFSYVQTHASQLLLPDQDVLNALYGDRILPLDDAVWNYDARNYSSYLMRSGGAWDMPWVMAHTAILHFCGKEKPWNPHYHRRFGVLYLHYMQLAERTWTLFAGDKRAQDRIEHNRTENRVCQEG